VSTQSPYPTGDQNPYPTPNYPSYPADGPEQLAGQPYQPYPEVPPPPPIYPAYSQPLGTPPGYAPYSQPLGAPPAPPPAYPAYSQPLGYPPQPAPYPVAAYPIPIYQPAEPGSGLAVTALVLGIIGVATGLLLFLIPGCGIFITGPLSVLSIIFGALGRRSISRRAMATVGLILGIVSLVLLIGSIVFIVVFEMSMVNSNPTP